MALLKHLQDIQQYSNGVYDHDNNLQTVCENLTWMLEAKDEEIRRINSHCEYLMQLYYDSEEMLARRGAELLKIKAKLEMCTCSELKIARAVGGLNEDTMNKHLETHIRQSLDSKIERSHTENRSRIESYRNGTTSKSMSLPCSSKNTFSQDDTELRNVYTQPQSSDLRSLQSTALSHQSEDESDMSVRQSLSTGWSDFSQFIDDSPLLNISNDFSLMKPTFGTVMPDEVARSKADILVIDHSNISSSDISETSSVDNSTGNENNTIKNMSSDDEDSQRTQVLPPCFEESDIFESGIDTSKNQQSRQDMSAESGYNTAMDTRTGNLETTFSEDSGLEDPYVSSKRLKPKAVSYTFEIVPSKASNRMPITSKTTRKSMNLQSSNVTMKNGINQSKNVNRRKYLSNTYDRTTRSLVPLQVKDTNTKSFNLYNNKKADIPLKQPSPPPLERKSTYTKEDLEYGLKELEKSEELNFKNDTFTKEDIERALDQLQKSEKLDFGNNEIYDENVNYFIQKKEAAVDDMKSRAIIDEIFSGSGRNSRAKENYPSGEVIKSARFAKSMNQYLTEPPRPVTANTHSIGRHTKHETSETKHGLSNEISNITIYIKKNVVSRNSPDQLSPSPELKFPQNKRLLNVRPTQPKPIGHSLDTKLYKESQPVQNTTKSFDLHGSLQLEGITSPRAYIAHLKCAKNKALDTDHDDIQNGTVITLKQKDTILDLHGSTMFIPHAPTARKCSTPNSHRRQNYEYSNEMAKTWTQLFS